MTVESVTCVVCEERETFERFAGVSRTRALAKWRAVLRADEERRG